MANVGLRNVCFEVDDLLTIVDDLAAKGYGLVGGIGEFEDTWRMTYVRGPEGIIVRAGPANRLLSLRLDRSKTACTLRAPDPAVWATRSRSSEL